MPDDRPSEKQRLLADQYDENRGNTILPKGETPLTRRLDEMQLEWLLEHASDRFEALHKSLDGWRSKLARFEEMSENDFSSRIRPPDPDKTDAVRSVFEHQNYTLGLVGGFCDFVFAQAKDDIFGISPWIAATPEGVEDIDLAESVSKHVQWKFGQSNMQETLTDAAKLAVDLGTAFVKVRWEDMSETYDEVVNVAWSESADAPVLGPDGEKITDEAMIPDELRGPDIGWREELVTKPLSIYRNVDLACLDYRNVAFEPTAPELDLRHTPFFSKFSMGLHDLCAHFGLTEEQKDEIITVLNWEPDTEGRDHREEENAQFNYFREPDAESNPQITLVEGFLRCDPMGTGKPIRVHIVFSPTLRVLFRADYLANVMPEGILPVFPVRCFKQSRRIIGKGYWEKFEDTNNAVDEQHNGVLLRNRQSAEVFKVVRTHLLKDGAEGQDLVNTPFKIWEAEGDARAEDIFSAFTLPDNNGRAVEILNQQMQMGQMISGISSAAQGELKGVPQSNTATGVKQLTSRGATLVKAQIDQIKTDLGKPAEFSVHLTYANQDHDETFTWGEGRETELLEIKRADVQGLRMNVKLTLTQAQNMEKLEHSQAAINIVLQYGQMQPAQQFQYRRVLIQALKQLGFNDAEDMAEQQHLDPMALVEMVDPALQPYFMQAIEQANADSSGAPDAGTDAPVTADE